MICPKCKGSGEVRVPALDDTVELIVGFGGPVEAVVLAKAAKVTAAAMHARLKRLEAVGVVRPVPSGKPGVWAWALTTAVTLEHRQQVETGGAPLVISPAPEPPTGQRRGPKPGVLAGPPLRVRRAVLDAMAERPDPPGVTLSKQPAVPPEPTVEYDDILGEGGSDE